MKILLTNDDGISAPGIQSIYRELKEIGSVTVIAPDRERSSIGHAITLSSALTYKKISVNRNFSGFGVNGTPADCVKLGVHVIMKQKPDLVVSGINLGNNDGCSVFYSGTVAGAREGALIGIPSIALSLATFTNPDFSFAAKFGVKAAKRVIKHGLPKGTFLNINVPNVSMKKIKGVKVTRQNVHPIHTTFKKKTDKTFGNVYLMSGKIFSPDKDITNDTYALSRRYVTITPISCDTIDHDILNVLSTWKW